jgi:dUTP pyrophosphatase
MDFLSYNRYDVGDRVGQLIIIKYPYIEFEEVDKLSETERGTGGYGSTGK